MIWASQKHYWGCTVGAFATWNSEKNFFSCSLIHPLQQQQLYLYPNLKTYTSSLVLINKQEYITVLKYTHNGLIRSWKAIKIKWSGKAKQPSLHHFHTSIFRAIPCFRNAYTCLLPAKKLTISLILILEMLSPLSSPPASGGRKRPAVRSRQSIKYTMLTPDR